MFLHGFSTFRMRKYSYSASKLNYPFDPFPGTRCLILKLYERRHLSSASHLFHLITRNTDRQYILHGIVQVDESNKSQMIYGPKWDERYTRLPIVKWSNLNVIKAYMIARRDVGANYCTSTYAQIRVTGENAQDSDTEDDLVLVKKLALVLGWHGREGEVPAQEIE